MRRIRESHSLEALAKSKNKSQNASKRSLQPEIPQSNPAELSRATAAKLKPIALPHRNIQQQKQALKERDNHVPSTGKTEPASSQ